MTGEAASRNLLDGTRPFVKREQEFEFLRQVKYVVHGFGGDDIKIYQWKDRRTGEWLKPLIKWSGEARDREQNPDCLKSTMCFALALQDAVEHATRMTEKAVTE